MTEAEKLTNQITALENVIKTVSTTETSFFKQRENKTRIAILKNKIRGLEKKLKLLPQLKLNL